MALTPDTRIGSYEVVAAIGAGGMGEVYRARDAKLGRDVALKVLPAAFVSDPDRLARFQPLDLSDPDHPKPGKPEPFLRTPANEREPAFSPDGRWIAYRSTESGNPEIYVRPFPNSEGAGKWQVSTGGGVFPAWSRNNRELFYMDLGQRIMVAEYTAKGDSFAVGKPRQWIDKPVIGLDDFVLDLAPDGKRFPAFIASEGTEARKGSVHVTFLLNFFDELRRRIPATR